MVHRVDWDEAPDTTPEAVDIEQNADVTIERWLTLLARLLPPPPERQEAICDELREHIRERTRDLMLRGDTEDDAVRTALEELGEVADLAQRFQQAFRTPRRRRIMQLTIIGLAITTLTASGLLVKNQIAAPTPAMVPAMTAVETSLERDVTSTQDDADSIRLTVSYDREPVEDVIERISSNIGPTIVVDWGSLEYSTDPEVQDEPRRMTLQCTDCSLAFVLDEIVDVLSENHLRVDWRLANGVVRIDDQYDIDRDEVVIRTYQVLDVVDAIVETDELGSRSDGINVLAELMYELVAPDYWVDLGGEMASMKYVKGTMFIQAPKRLHTGVEWILDELRTDHPIQANARVALNDARLRIQVMEQEIEDLRAQLSAAQGMPTALIDDPMASVPLNLPGLHQINDPTVELER